jgi:acetyl esterase/lipase/predicted RNA-binding Zn-ribbon protein involved in translation (DUF1610 family)
LVPPFSTMLREQRLCTIKIQKNIVKEIMNPRNIPDNEERHMMNNKTVRCKNCGQEISKKVKKCPNCGAKSKKRLVKRITLGSVAAVLLVTIGTLSTVWSGHIPEKYNYNKELPAASSVMAWTNMKSSIVQSGMKKTISEKIENLENSKAPEGFKVSKYSVPVEDGTIKMYSIESNDLADKKDVPVILYIHGGAFYFPLTEEGLDSMAYYAKAMGARVFLPDYRTSLDHPFPTPMNDSYASALYLEDNADKLGIDMDRLIIYGDSAGAALAAGVTQYIRDNGGPEARGQMLVYPVLDNSMKYESMKEYKDAAWPLNANENMWEVYLKNGDNGQIKYAAPMQSDNFSDLPQAYIEPSEMDILRDEGLSYADKLKEAGVNVETYVMPGGYHGFDSDQTNPLVKQMLKKRVEIMQNMIGQEYN